ncbi:MAG: FecR family protein [Bacteroides sp.]|nr:FecR family protein [Bacteroides sp.]
MDTPNIENLLISYYDGKATADEVQKIESWIKSSEENHRMAMDVYTLLLMTDTQQVTESINLKEELSKVKGRMPKNKYHISWWNRIQRIAVILIIPMAITIFLLYNQSKPVLPVQAQIFEVRTQPGMITSFRLPDSTLVYLNSGSVLQYPSFFTDRAREITLSGEAYFEVTKDAKRKFIVSTPGKSKVEVLGTRFNLEAFSDMDEVITTLVEGKVKFSYEKDGHGYKMLMQPGQKVIYNNKDGRILSYDTYGEAELAWKDNKVIFEKNAIRNSIAYAEKAL